MELQIIIIMIVIMLSYIVICGIKSNKENNALTKKMETGHDQAQPGNPLSSGHDPIDYNNVEEEASLN